jgi:chromosome segregation ATPase
MLFSEMLEDLLRLAKTQQHLYEEVSETFSVEIYKNKQEISSLTQHIALVASECEKLKLEPQGPGNLYSDLLKQRDQMENSLVSIKSSHAKCLEEQENLQINLETRRKENEEKEKELKFLLEELKNLSETGIRPTKPLETPKKKEIPKMEIKSFPASSYSFNFGMRQNSSKDRIVLNRSFNNGEKSSRSSNVSNNTSMVIES